MVEKQKIDLGKDGLIPLFINLGVPATIGMAVNALYNVIDTIFLGRGVGPVAITALTVAFPIQTILLAFSLVVALGAATMISIFLGEKNLEEANHVAGNAFLSVFFLSVMLFILGMTFQDNILRLFGASSEILPYARQYMSVIMIGWLWFPLLIVSNNMARAQGDAKTAMLSMVMSALLNLILAPIFIFVLKWGIRGAGIATIISQFAGLMYMVIYFVRKKSIIRVHFRHLKLKNFYLRKMYAIGASSFARQASASLIGLFMNRSLLYYGGDLPLAAYGIVAKTHTLIFMPILGLSQALQPILGYNYGAKNYARSKKSIYMALYITTAFAILGTLMVEIFPGAITRVFTTDKELIALSTRALRVMSILIPIVASQIIAGVVFQSLGKAVPAFFLSLLRQFIVLIPLVLIFPVFWGLEGIWYTFPVSDVIAVAISVWMLKKELKLLETKAQSAIPG